ncbi:MAG TPA: hypothetical protein VKA19_13085 [Alphaproteobacteria bacterium]|nr:hypothetical protein [Alphaproteobacteria bacterium]
MTLTEKEAREKWCPFAREVHGHGGNRAAYGSGSSADIEGEPGDAEQFGREMADMHPCISSDCMAWRWSDPEEEYYSAYVGFQRRTKPEGDNWTDELGSAGGVIGWTRPIKNRRGYCGLAGRPE